jgi:hypothetical protein
MRLFGGAGIVSNEHLEHRELEVLPRVGPDVGEKKLELNDRVGRLVVKRRITYQQPERASHSLHTSHHRIRTDQHAYETFSILIAFLAMQCAGSRRWSPTHRHWWLNRVWPARAPGRGRQP